MGLKILSKAGALIKRVDPTSVPEILGDIAEEMTETTKGAFKQGMKQARRGEDGLVKVAKKVEKKTAQFEKFTARAAAKMQDKTAVRAAGAKKAMKEVHWVDPRDLRWFERAKVPYGEPFIMNPWVQRRVHDLPSPGAFKGKKAYTIALARAGLADASDVMGRAKRSLPVVSGSFSGTTQTGQRLAKAVNAYIPHTILKPLYQRRGYTRAARKLEEMTAKAGKLSAGFYDDLGVKGHSLLDATASRAGGALRHAKGGIIKVSSSPAKVAVKKSAGFLATSLPAIGVLDDASLVADDLSELDARGALAHTGDGLLNLTPMGAALNFATVMGSKGSTTGVFDALIGEETQSKGILTHGMEGLLGQPVHQTQETLL